MVTGPGTVTAVAVADGHTPLPVTPVAPPFASVTRKGHVVVGPLAPVEVGRDPVPATTQPPRHPSSRSKHRTGPESERLTQYPSPIFSEETPRGSRLYDPQTL